MDQVKIGKFIREIRLKNNLTQAEFAEKYGVTSQAVSKWENAKNMPDIMLLRQISKDFNVNIEEILNGKINKRNYLKKILIILLIIIIIISLIYLFLNMEKDFQFKTISANCKDFSITGSIAYNDSKSSIYISNIEYCGEEDETKYQEIECVLYEVDKNIETKISSYFYDEKNITLEEFLQDVSFTAINYERICKEYQDHNLYLLINAKDLNDKNISYKIPLSLTDNCSK